MSTVNQAQSSELWQQQLAKAVSTPQALCKQLDLAPTQLGMSEAAMKSFRLRVPLSFIKRMKKGDMNDPLLLQVLPHIKEEIITPGYSHDPLQEHQYNPVPGLLHKYHGRVLLTVTGACAIHCRYCFRRHFPYEDKIPSQAGWQAAVDYITKDHSIHEVILSGGDPLVVKDAQLIELIMRLEKIPHLKKLRIHTRLPVVLPARMTDSLIQFLTKTRLKIIIIIHCNHANEINDEVYLALEKIKKSGIELLNQAVLLNNINDNTQALIELSEALFSAGVLPYYLHLLDPVQGAQHFDVSEQKARELIAAIAEKLPGYLVPKLVREVPGGKMKKAVG